MKEFETPALRARITRLLGGDPGVLRAVSGGYTPAARWLTEGPGRPVFIKMGTTKGTARALRMEAEIYHQVEAACVPEQIAWEDDPAHPLLVLEDLSGATWPPPWSPELVEGVRAALAEVHAMRAPIPRFATSHAGLKNGWRAVAADDGPFSSLGLVSPKWLEDSLPALIAAADRVPTEGEFITHFDVRSDNLCMTPRGVVLVDWNGGCLGNPDLDLGFWLPSLAFEGGPAPEAILPDRPDVAAWVSGFFAERAGQAQIPEAPRVRMVQREQLSTALPWAIRQLGLPPALRFGP